jgi:5-formyltetrahydrofolate cyclo-ligase
MHLEKNRLRKTYLEQRDAMDPVVQKRSASLIRQQLFKHPAWRDAEQILCYVSFRSEVDTHMIIQEGIRYKKKIHIPIFHPLQKEITPISELKRWGDLIPTGTGLLEPREDAQVLADPAAIQLVLVPGMVFDRKGGRLGFGGGYFDRLLARMPQAKRLGLAFSNQIHDTPLPHEAHDIDVHSILTETEEIKIA